MEARKGLGSMELESHVCVQTPRSSRRSVCAFNSHALSSAVNKPIGQWIVVAAQVCSSLGFTLKHVFLLLS